MKAKAIFKYNSGLGALLCSNCRTIIREGFDLTKDDWKALRGELHMDPQYCDKCSNFSKTELYKRKYKE